MRKIYFYPVCVMAILIFGFSSANGGPVISASSGTAVDGENMIITGSSFGTNPLSMVEWLGGSNGYIEQGVTGQNFEKAGWTTSAESSAQYPPKYTNAYAHSGSKSIISQWPVEAQYGSGLSYDTGITGVGSIYITWWVFFDHVDSQGQWKFFRLRHDPTYTDSAGEIFASQWYNTSGGNYQGFNLIMCASGDASSDPSCYPSGNYSDRYPSNALTSGKWVRVELFGKESSSAGVKDGTYEMYFHLQNTAPVLMNNNSVDWKDNIKTRVAGITNRWRYVVFQNYWGNITGGTGSKEKAYLDDIFIQVGTQARVEVGDNATWANCKHREIQMPVSWNSSQIELTFNQGSFSGGIVYLYVVDADGKVSDYDATITGAQGYPITVGLKIDSGIELPGTTTVKIQ
jgi:hypothetical protein